ncbi:MAG: ABC transporter permease [Bowdeniella nasicola]|nr:ABC transporter permease [Bowdeniella nasicola]
MVFTTPPPRRRDRSRMRARHILAPIVFAVALLIAWSIGSAVLDPYLLPPPGAVATRTATDLTSGQLLPYVGETFLTALLGSALGAVAGVPLGYAIASFRIVRTTLSPWVAVSQAIPAIALAPILVMWVGYGRAPIVILCALMVFFPIVLTTQLGIRDIDRDVLDAARLDGAAGFDLVRRIQAPLAAPSILTGIRGGFTLSVTGAVVGEFTMGGRGLGLLLTVYRDAADTEGLFAVLIVLCSAAAALYAAISYLEHRMRGLW